MKKYLLTTISILIVSLASAQAPVQVKGTLSTTYNKPVKLFKVIEGEMAEIASAVPQLDNKFGFTFYPEYEGFYAIGTGVVGSQTDNIIFYFKQGDQLELIINDKDYKLAGNGNTKENQILTQWNQLTYATAQKSFNWMKTASTFVDFFPDLEDLNQKAKTFADTNKSGNPRFDRNLKNYMQWDMAAIATNFLNTPRSAHPAKDELSDYYQSITMADFSKSANQVYQMPWGKRTLSGAQMTVLKTKNIPFTQGISMLETELSLLQNDTLKGDAVLNYLARQKDYAAYKVATDQYNRYFLTESQQKRSIAIQNNLAQLKTGDQGLNFSFPDKNGKKVQFADLKGKVVLVDVWATWCGPCKAEIPHLKKLEEEMHGTDVQVVSISVDEDKDKEKWLKMIKDENLGGLQLFASGWGDFAAYYKIKGIPRFMVFDKQGKIVTVDSPRPSNPELKTLLNKVLSQK